MKRFFLFIVFSFLGVMFVLFAQNNNVHPRIEKNGVEYYEYVVRQGEGLWSISQRFGVSQADLHKNNPEINTSGGLKVGQKLVIPIKKNVEDSSLKKEESGVSYLTHVVERKQTLYAISKLYDVKIDDLISCNKLQGSEIKEGQSLLIPRKTVVVRESVKESDTITFIEHEVKRKETLFSISRQYGVDINDITQYNEIRESLPKGMILKIPQKRAIEKNLVDTLVVEDEKEFFEKQKDSSLIIKIGILLPFRLSDKKANDRFLDFYKGCLLALSNAKKKGVSTEVFTYDTENSKETVFAILKDDKLKEVDLIIGPAYADIIPL
ncbi:MAG: LysM peptidoglycan-binding domain-containing protein, partial [Paludibacteraceae bacterium]|nr:LysM peptidoglycan-binding domain-containing protein [Paludibacteraceae bacterium]